HRVLIVVVADSGMVKDAMLELEQGVAKEELDRISTFLNSEYCGQPLDRIKSDLIKRLEGEKDSCYHMVKMASGLLQEGLLSDYGDKFYIEGSSRLFDQPEFADLNKRRKMARLLDEKYRLLNLMKGDMHDDGLKVHIGQENKDVDLKDCSIVTSNYKIGDKVIGTLGVIGPVRMGYSRIIPAIDYLSQMIGRMLAEMNEEWD
ncbi:MAG: hypothetical protein HQ593_07500, partial [Candidatus Omnitrophica bacterium]|nr:hypothetical protein [Candidatus Omnitrophota bacterium]